MQINNQGNGQPARGYFATYDEEAKISCEEWANKLLLDVYCKASVQSKKKTEK